MLSDGGAHHGPDQLTGAVADGGTDPGQQPRVIIQTAGHGRGRPIGQGHLGPVRLPHLVRASSSESPVGRLRATQRTRHHQPAPHQNARHGRRRGRRDTLGLQRPPDRIRPAISPVLAQSLTGPHDQLFQSRLGQVRHTMRATRPLGQTRDSLGPEPRPPLVERLPTDRMSPAKAATSTVSSATAAAIRKSIAATVPAMNQCPQPVRCQRCPETYRVHPSPETRHAGGSRCGHKVNSASRSCADLVGVGVAVGTRSIARGDLVQISSRRRGRVHKVDPANRSCAGSVARPARPPTGLSIRFSARPVDLGPEPVGSGEKVIERARWSPRVIGRTVRNA